MSEADRIHALERDLEDARKVIADTHQAITDAGLVGEPHLHLLPAERVRLLVQQLTKVEDQNL